MYVFLCSGGRHIFMHNALWLLLVPKQPSFSWEAKQHQVYLNSNTQQIQQMQHLHHKQLEVISAHPIGIAGSPWYRNSAWWMTPLELVRGSSNVSVWDPTVPPWYQCPSECAADIPRWLHPDLLAPKLLCWQPLSGIPHINLWWWNDRTSWDGCNERMHPHSVKISF